jgi:hypothetical protein
VRERAESRGEKKGARAAGAEGVCDRQTADCEQLMVMEAVTQEMEEALRRGILRGVRSGVRCKAKVRRFFFGVAVRAVGLERFAEVVCVSVCIRAGFRYF